jgi:hypothetical protein
MCSSRHHRPLDHLAPATAREMSKLLDLGAPGTRHCQGDVEAAGSGAPGTSPGRQEMSKLLDLGAPSTRHCQQSWPAGDDEAAKDPGAGGLEQAPEAGRAEVASSAGRALLFFSSMDWLQAAAGRVEEEGVGFVGRPRF